MEYVTKEAYEGRCKIADERFARDKDRVDRLEKMIEESHELAQSDHELATEMKSMRKDIDSLSKRQEIIEQKPAKRWEQAMGYIMAAVLSGVVGYFIAAIS